MKTSLNTNTNYQPLLSLWQNHQLNHSLTQKITTMKKQIILIVVALFAGISVVFGQAIPGSAPRPLENCETGPLNPIAGVPYNYSAEIIPDGGTAYWFATFANTSFIQNGVLTSNQENVGGNFIASAVNYQNTSPGDPSPSTTTITWKSEGLAQVDATNPLFVAIHYTAPASGCADNLKVYRINPMNAFLVNIMNLGTAYDLGQESCVSEIESAEYNLATSMMEYDFGSNLLPFEVIAANFTGSYDLSFRILGLQTGQNANIYWSYVNDFSGANLLPGGPFFNQEVAGPTITTNEPSTANGVSIYVWLEVNHNNFEGLADVPITLAVAGLNAANQGNIRWNDCAILVDLSADLAASNAPDYAVHTLKARPTVTPGPGLNFEPQTQP